MNTLKNFLFAAVGFVIIVGTLSIVQPQALDSLAAEVKEKPSSVNVLNTHRTQLEFFFTAGFGDGLISLFTVPAGKKLTLTDAVFNHALIGTTATHVANIVRRSPSGDKDLFRVFVVDNNNAVLHFQTGYEFFPDDEVVYGTGGATPGNVTVSLIAYLSDL